jgi:hypothetical protein
MRSKTRRIRSCAAAGGRRLPPSSTGWLSGWLSRQRIYRRRHRGGRFGRRVLGTTRLCGYLRIRTGLIPAQRGLQHRPGHPYEFDGQLSGRDWEADKRHQIVEASCVFYPVCIASRRGQKHAQRCRSKKNSDPGPGRFAGRQWGGPPNFPTERVRSHHCMPTHALSTQA